MKVILFPILLETVSLHSYTAHLKFGMWSKGLRIFPAVSINKDVTVISNSSPPGHWVPEISSHELEDSPYREPWGTQDVKNTGYWPQIAETHIRGMISASPDSCIFPYVLCVCVCVCVCVSSSVISDSAILGTVAHQAPLQENTRVGCYSLLQGIFPTQGSNPPALQADSLPYEPPALSHEGSPPYVKKC